MKFCENNPDRYGHFFIKTIGWQELEPILINDQICQKIIMQVNYGDYLKLIYW